MEKFCEIFKTGTHVSSNGIKKEWTTDDLDKMVYNFYSKNPDVPNVIGHPKTNDPAYGWVKNIKRVGESLFASFKQVAPEFAEAVNNGFFKTRSISVHPDGTLRHIGWLGAKAPAIKGLANFRFEEDECAEIYDFSELTDYKFDTTASIFEKIRDFLIEKFSLETADKLIAKYDIEQLKELEDKSPDEVKSFCEETIEPSGGKEQVLSLENARQQDDNTQNFEEELQKRDNIIADLKAEKEKLEARSRKEKYLQFAENAIQKGNITPAQKDIVVDFMEAAYQADTNDGTEFAEADVNTLTLRFKGFLNSLKQIDFSEIDESTIKNDETVDFSDAEALSEAISKTVATEKSKGKIISESQALKILKKANSK